MMYIDVIESTNKADSFLYYKNSSNFGNTFPSDEELEGQLILTQSQKVYDICKSKKLDVNFLHLYLGFSSPLGLYEIFSYFFDGKVHTDFDMIEAILNGLIRKTGYCFCFKLGVTFCWFSVSKSGLKILGSMQFCQVMNKYYIGRFIKQLRYEIARSGYNLERVKWLLWDEYDINNEFANYIVDYDILSAFFNKVEGFKGLHCKEVIQLLSNNLETCTSVRAVDFVECLKNSFSSLGLYEKDGILYSGTTYYKDYSSCVSSIIDSKKLSWGIILDCEGKKGMDGSLSNGLRELGGIIYCRYEKTLLNVDTFICDEIMLEDTLEMVLSNYKEKSGVTNKPIDVLVYGASDKKMFFASLSSVNKSTRNKIEKRFKFVDCKDYLTKSLDVPVMKLESLAELCKVSCLKPVHNPLNDCRTLFNVLANVLLQTGDFIV